MKYTDIDFNREENGYAFDCPFCGERYIVSESEACSHLIAIYEEINQCVPFLKADVYDAIAEKLFNRRTKGPENFRDFWESEYKPEPDEMDEIDDDQLDEIREECVCEYMESYLSMDDILWFLDRFPAFRGYRKYSQIFVIDDGEGNSTQYLMIKG